MIKCSQKVRSVCPYRKTCGGGVYKEGSDCDKFAESLQNKKAHNPGGGPITREQVEKMRSEWKHRFTTDDSVFCTSCKTTFRAYYDEYNFCPDCGAPMTDKAVDILWKRLEAMQDAEIAELEKQTAAAEAEVAKTKAQAEADVEVIEAQAEAESNRIIAQSITPELIQMTEAQARLEHGWVTVQGAGAVVVDDAQ